MKKLDLKTELLSSYWENTGAYQEEYDRLYSELVPNSGKANTLHGELIRSISCLYHEYCNNGNSNAANHIYETVEEEDDEDFCEVIVDTLIEDRYANMINFIRKYIPTISDILTTIEGIICAENLAQYAAPTYFGSHNMNVYDRAVDEVVRFCLTTDNIEI